MAHYQIQQGDVAGNRKDISAVLERNLDVRISERYEWNYQRCPYGKARCWLATYQENPIGTVAAFPRKFFIRSQSVPTAVVGDFAVDKKHRAFGPAATLQKTVQEQFSEDGSRFVYTMPNQLSEKLATKLGYVRIGEVKRYIKILSPKYFFRKYESFSPIERLLSPPVQGALRLLSREGRFFRGVDCDIEIPRRFDERIDAMNDRQAGNSGIRGDRSAAFLNWRFMESPDDDYRAFVVSRKTREVLGYIVYAGRGLNDYRIVDLAADDMELSLDTLFAAFLKYLRALKAESLTIKYFGNSQMKKKLKAFGFLTRNEDNSTLMTFTKDETLQQILSQEENWFLTAADNDV